jgi:AcrR family transcriptional regulator
VPRQNVDTRSEISAVAAELFAEQGYEQTSLREIAERLGITKAALYYHFPSKNELLSSLVEPLIDELRELTDELERASEQARRDPRRVVEAYFDICLRRRLVLRSLVRDAHAAREVEIVRTMTHWRERVDAVLVGSDEPADRVRAVVALGGLQDTVVLFDDADMPAVREPAIDAAMRALTEGER